jgi:hypothetical protein
MIATLRTDCSSSCVPGPASCRRSEGLAMRWQGHVSVPGVSPERETRLMACLPASVAQRRDTAGYRRIESFLTMATLSGRTRAACSSPAATCTQSSLRPSTYARCLVGGQLCVSQSSQRGPRITAEGPGSMEPAAMLAGPGIASTVRSSPRPPPAAISPPERRCGNGSGHDRRHRPVHNRWPVEAAGPSASVAGVGSENCQAPAFVVSEVVRQRRPCGEVRDRPIASITGAGG